MFNRLALILVLLAPCAAFAGQGMSVEDSFAVASNAPSRDVDAIAPAAEGMHEPGASRGGEDPENHASTDGAGTHGAHNGRSGGNDAAATTTRPHKNHGKAPWQSLLPGVMK
jgi:hypothetical protein